MTNQLQQKLIDLGNTHELDMTHVAVVVNIDKTIIHVRDKQVWYDNRYNALGLHTERVGYHITAQELLTVMSFHQNDDCVIDNNGRTYDIEIKNIKYLAVDGTHVIVIPGKLRG